MRTVRLAVLAAMLGCLLPAAAPAATSSWSQPRDFTTNPAATGQWSYVDSATPSGGQAPPAAVGAMQSLSPTSAGWQDPADSGALVASAGSTLTIRPAADRVAGVGWTSPFQQQQTVTVSGTFQPAAPSGCASAPDWTLWVASQSTAAPAPSTSQTIDETLTVAPRDTIYLTVDYGPQGYSAACDAANVTLDVGVAQPPTVTLNPLGPGRLTTAAPTLSGTAGTAPGDERTVYVGIFAGPDTSGKLVRLLTTSPNPDGTFAVTVSPDLPDGQYTALAGQKSGAGSGASRTVTFFVKALPPALSVLSPARGAAVANSHPTLSGLAGAVPGDAPFVTLMLFTLDGNEGQLLGRVKVPVTAGRWSLRWAHALGLGLYTAEVEQSDDVGHVSIYVDRFLIVPSAHRRTRRRAAPHRHLAKRR